MRGYRLFPVHKIKQIYQDDQSATKHVECSKYQISVSKFKETERFGSCEFNALPQYEIPIFSFDARINDNESIDHEDLVAWIPIGGLHIPSAEDFPSTTTTGKPIYLFLKTV